MQTQLAFRDKDLEAADFALPAAASANTTSAAIDLGAKNYAKNIRRGDQIAVQLDVPALTTTIVPDTRTVTASIEASDAADFGSGVVTLDSVTSTGAGGAGVAAVSLNVNIQFDCPRYLRGKVAFGASTTTGAAVSASFGLRF